MAKKIQRDLLVAELEAALKRGDGYIMASYGQNPRTGHLDLSVPESQCKAGWKKNGWYYAQYSGGQRAQALAWREKCVRVWDCNGMAEGIYEMHTGVCINARARDNYATWCGVKGAGTIPAKYRVPGAAVFWGEGGASNIHHVAFLYKPVQAGHPEGDWYLIEARGVMYGVVKTKLYSRSPNFWGLMSKYFEYGETEGAAETAIVAQTLGSRVLRNGSDGTDVREMQAGLIRLGYDLGKWGADGDFGDQTEMAVKAFQEDNGLEPDGKFGPRTLEKFEAALKTLEARAENPRRVVIEGGSCYVRDAPNTGGKEIGVAHRGDALKFGGQIAETGWLQVDHNGKEGWVSGKYGRLAE